jgi:endoglucanase
MHASVALTFEGVNLAGAEFGTTGKDSNGLPVPILPGVEGVDYAFPTAQEIAYYAGKGMNTFRLPFLWERLEPDLSIGTFDSAQLASIVDFVSNVMTVTGGTGTVILDPHNFGHYLSRGTGYALGTADVSTEAYAAMWAQLATVFKDNSHVMFGLMNEPAGLPVITTETWFGAAQSAIDAIRGAGAANTILASGNYFTGAWSWSLDIGLGTPNSQVMGGLVDPGVNGSGKNLLYEVHQYYDADYSGTSASIDHSDPVTLFGDFTNWLIATGNKGFLGEFGVAANPLGSTAPQDAITGTLDYLEAHSDVWAGWTYWAGGPLWGDYMFSIEPTNNFTTDAPQMAYLAPYLVVPEPSPTALLGIAALLILAYAAACTARNLTSPISSSSASSATRRKPSVASVSATCRLPS